MEDQRVIEGETAPPDKEAKEFRSRRRTLGIALGAGVVGAAGAGIVQASTGQSAWRREVVELEVALLGGTWRDSTANWSESESDFRGMPFQVEGWIYPSGTMPDPSDGFVPTSEASIGRWFCRGSSLGYADRPEPHVTSTQEFYFGEITPDSLFADDLITTSGLEGTITRQVAARPVLGGTGRFLGATGVQRQVPTGMNTSLFSDGFGNGPNLRMTFELLLPNV